MSKRSKLPNIGERVEHGARLVNKANRLLDVGCGDGVIKELLPNVKEVYGVDSSTEALKKSKVRGLRVKKVDLDKQPLPYKTNYFDVVTCLDVIEHVRDPRILLSGILRVLKPGGRLIISTPNVRFSDHLFKLVIEGSFPKTSLDPDFYDGDHIHFFTYKDLIELLEETGFSIFLKDGIINKKKRGWKGQIIEFLLGKEFMLEFRTPGILIIARK